MTKLWQKGWELDKTVERFETKDDLVFDNMLAKWDVIGSLAQAAMLEKIGIVSTTELKTLRLGLLEVLGLIEKDQFQLTFGDEDIHSKVENYLTEKYGDVGKKIHTARSRNDQVLTDLRLFTKDSLVAILSNTLALSEQFASFAKEYEFIPMPGYTHMQKAMPSSVGMWAAAFSYSLLDDAKLLEATLELNDKSPLGSAAGYGAPLNLDRELTAKLLGFAELQQNPIYCQNSRGKLEAAVVASLNSILTTINRFATDLLLFTTAEFDYFNLDAKVCSGSSIMPQKKNLDLAELLRSKIHISMGYYQQIASTSLSLPSGYNRDIQDTKKPLMESLELADDCIKVTSLLLSSTSPKEDRLRAALTNEIFATHNALEQVLSGASFRDAYQEAGKLSYKFDDDIDDVIKKSVHAGGTGNLGLSELLKNIKASQERQKKLELEFTTTINKLTTEKK